MLPIIAAIVALLLIYVMLTFNKLKKLQVKIKASIQEIGNQLKRQATLIPNLETTVKAAAKHEKDIYQTITKARAGVNSAVDNPSGKNLSKALDAFQGMLSGVKVLVESNPNLQANENFLSLMNKLEDTADKLMYSRKLLIDLVAQYNERLVVFPSNLIANLFGFKAEEGLQTPETGEHLSVGEAETKDHQVSL